jgi:pentatricopeptide repeat protein
VSIYRENVDLAHVKGTSYTNALMLLGNAYSDNGRLDEALRCYREIMASVSNRDALCDMIQTTINKSDDVDFKLKSYLEFRNLAPDNFGFNYHLGLLYGKEKGELTKAIVYFGKAVEIRPNDVNALRGLSRAYRLSKDYERAAFYFEKVVEQNPGNLPFLDALRDLYRLTGNHAKEQEVLKRMEGLEPSQAGSRPGNGTQRD